MQGKVVHIWSHSGKFRKVHCVGTFMEIHIFLYLLINIGFKLKT
jgi:hypothetical protein